MIELQETIIKNAIPPAAIKDDAAFSSLVIDKKDLRGAAYAEFVIALGATDVAMATLKVMESDTKTNDTTLGGTPAEVIDTASKPGATDDDKVLVIGVDLRKSRQRYMQLQAPRKPPAPENGSQSTFLSAVLLPGGCVSPADGLKPRR